MIIVRENINEKFTSESDPISDMGIGIRYIWDNLKRGDIVRFKKPLLVQGSNAFFPEDSYIKINSVTDIHDYLIKGKKRITFTLYKNKENLLNDYPDPCFEVWQWGYDFFKEYFEYVNKIDLKESLNEKFTEDSDPIKDLRFGTPYLIKEWFLKDLKVSEKSFDKYVIINDDYTINLNYSVVFKNVIENKIKYEFPEYVQFNETRSFDVSKLNLTILKGCPKIVHGNFECDDNKLTSLEYCPMIVEGDFICKNNTKHFSKKEINERCKVLGKIIN